MGHARHSLPFAGDVNHRQRSDQVASPTTNQVHTHSPEFTVNWKLTSARRFEIKEFITPFKERPFLFLTISSFFLYVGGFLGFTFLVAEARTHGMSAEMAGYLVPIMNGAS
jgi:hypothetical protein